MRASAAASAFAASFAYAAASWPPAVVDVVASVLVAPTPLVVFSAVASTWPPGEFVDAVAAALLAAPAVSLAPL